MVDSTAKTIWKYPLVIADSQVISAPRGAEFLSVLNQRGGLVLYALVPPGPPFVDYKVQIRGTGHPCGLDIQLDYQFVGTVEDAGIYFWHVFVEKKEV